MPQITVYIREKDLNKWKAIEKKSEFLHNALNNLPYTPTTTTVEHGIERKINSFTPEPKIDSSSLRSELPPLARACCLNKVKPCKHWNWTGENYTNILTGEIREVNELQD